MHNAFYLHEKMIMCALSSIKNELNAGELVVTLLEEYYSYLIFIVYIAACTQTLQNHAKVCKWAKKKRLNED